MYICSLIGPAKVPSTGVEVVSFIPHQQYTVSPQLSQFRSFQEFQCFVAIMIFFKGIQLQREISMHSTSNYQRNSQHSPCFLMLLCFLLLCQKPTHHLLMPHSSAFMILPGQSMLSSANWRFHAQFLSKNNHLLSGNESTGNRSGNRTQEMPTFKLKKRMSRSSEQEWKQNRTKWHHRSQRKN